MTKQDIISTVEDTLKKITDTIREKSKDIDDDSDAFKNFTLISSMTGMSVDKVIFTKISDKVANVGITLDTPSTEKSIEHIDSAISYLLLLKVRLLHNKFYINENFKPSRVMVIEDDGEID